MVAFPEIQDFMEHERWGECIFCQAIDGHPCPDSTYMVPLDLYVSIKAPTWIKEILGKTVTDQLGIDWTVVGFCSDGDAIIASHDNSGWDFLDSCDNILTQDEGWNSYLYTDEADLQNHYTIK